MEFNIQKLWVLQLNGF